MSFLIDDILSKSSLNSKCTNNYSSFESEYDNNLCSLENSFSDYGFKTFLNAEPHFSSFMLWPYGRFNPLRLCLANKSKIQVRFSQKQLELLEDRFSIQRYLSPDERHVLAEDLNLTDKQVKTWFQNRRAKWRRSHQTSNVEKYLKNGCDEK